MPRSIRSLLCVVMLFAVPVVALAQRSKTSSKPTLESISPTSVTAGSASFTLTAVGTNFVSGASAILWNGASLATTFVSTTQVTATVPNTLIASAGTVQVSVYVSGRSGGTSNALSLTIDASTTTTTTTTSAPMTLASSLPGGTVGTAYSAAMVSGGTAPYSLTLSSGALPAGLSFNTSSGALAGTPTTANSYSFAVTVKDSAAHSGSGSYVVSVVAATTPLSLASSLPNGTVGVAYNAPLASGGTAPYTFTVTSGAFPGGLSPNTSSGALAGNPTTAASYAFAVQVADSASHTASASYSLTIAASTTTTTSARRSARSSSRPATRSSRPRTGRSRCSASPTRRPGSCCSTSRCRCSTAGA